MKIDKIDVIVCSHKFRKSKYKLVNAKEDMINFEDCNIFTYTEICKKCGILRVNPNTTDIKALIEDES